MLAYSDGRLRIMNSRFGSTEAVLGDTPAGTISLGAWHYIEWYVKAGATTGATTLRVNTTTKLALTNVRTIDNGYGAEEYANYHNFRLGYHSSNGLGVVDDIYCIYGEPNESFLGDVVVETVYPNANGAYSEWRGSDGNFVDNYLLVDENPVSGSDAVKTSIGGARDMYQMGNLGTIATSIYAVQHNAYMDKDSSTGPCKVRITSKGIGGPDVKSNPFSPSVSAATARYMQVMNPDTGLPWTLAEVQGVQSGVEYVDGVMSGAPGFDALLEDFNDLSAWTNSGAVEIVTGGRTGAGASVPGTATLDYSIPVGFQSGTLTVGFALYMAAGTGIRDIIQFCSDDFATIHGRLVRYSSPQYFSYLRGTTLLGNTFYADASGWNYLEVQVTLSSTVGKVSFRFNQGRHFDLFDLNTKNGGTKTVFDGIRLTCSAVDQVNIYDDLYLTMGPGAPFKGDTAL